MEACYKFLDIDAAIKKLIRLKRENKKAIVYVIDFNNDITEKKLVTYDESCNIIRKAKTIVHNNDEYISHLEVFSILQKDISNILPKGIMHDILIGCDRLK